MYELDKKTKEKMFSQENNNVKFSIKHLLTLIVLLLGIIGLFVGVLTLDWYISEIAALFVAMGGH